MRSARSLFAVAVLVLAAPLFAATIELVPATAPPGADVILIGTGLGASDLAVTFTSATGTAVPAPIVSRGEVAEIRVPFAAATGPVRVTAGGSMLATLEFTLATDAAFARVSTLRATTRVAGPTKQPAAVTLRLPDGRAYLADTLNHRIVTIGADGELQVVAGTGRPGWLDGSATEAQLHAPAGVAYDASRNLLYVADTLNHCIRRIDSAGRVTTLAGSGRPADGDGHGASASFRQPTGIATDESGDIYVADTLNHKIRKVTPAGVVTTLAGTGAPSDRDGAALQAGFHAPSGIAIVSTGILVVTDTGNNIVRRIEAGQVVTLAGSRQPGFADGPGHLAQFNRPEGIAVGASGTVFVADTKNNRIRRIVLSTDGVTVSTVAGTGARGSMDGAPLSATFAGPSGLASAGALYVADSGNGTIRLIEPHVRLADIYPRRGPLTGNTIRVFGTGFVPGQTRVLVDGGESVVTYVSPTQVLAQLPPAEAGAADVTVITPAGTTMLAAAYVYLAAPTLTSVQPAKGPSAGGQQVTIRGSHFVVDDTRVVFGALPFAPVTATDATPVNGTTATATGLTSRTPPGTHGPVDISVVTPGGTVTLAGGYRYFDPPVLAGFSPVNGSAGTIVTITGHHFDADASGNAVRFGQLPAAILSASETSLVVLVPEGAITAPISITTEGGTVRSATDFVTAVLTAVTVTPAAAELEPGGRQQFTATATWSDGRVENVTATASWSSSDVDVATVDAVGLAHGTAVGAATIEARFGARAGNAQLTVRSAEPLPVDPATIAPPTDRTIAQPFIDTTRFLYTGPNAIQTGVAAGTIDEKRAAVMRGRILTRTGAPLGGAVVTIAGHPELGQTLSRADGMYDLVVNGGGNLTIRFQKAGYFAVERQPHVAWNDFTAVPDVVLTQLDSAVTSITSGAATAQMARGQRVTDADGARQATILFPAGTTAELVMPDGTSQPLPTLNVRATEYTVGTTGPLAMPADLPPTSGYTYCVELSADEAIAAGAAEVRFNKPVAVYVENFPGFRVGGIVPSGYYDRQRSAWIPSPNGRVVRITSITGGLAQLDTDGDGSADADSTLALLNIDEAERRQLAAIYTAGQSLWRVPVTHFTPWDYNWPYGPPLDAVPPKVTPPGEDPEGIEVNGPSSEPNLDDPVLKCGSVIECENRGLGEAAPIAGTPWALHYQSRRTEGHAAAYTIEIPLTGAALPRGIKAVQLEIVVAGRVVRETFSPAPNLKYKYKWDGTNAYGQIVEGQAGAAIRIGYTYPLVYQTPANFALSFARASERGGELARPRSEVTLWQFVGVDFRETGGALSGAWTNKAAGLGGWSLSPHHAYDPGAQVLYMGTGQQRSGQLTLLPVAGQYRKEGFAGDGGNATDAILNQPEAVAVGADGSVYIADSINYVVRKVDPSGRISTVAGTPGRYSENSIVGDGGPATAALLQYPWDLEVASDGTLYILDHAAIRKVSRGGIISTVAGTGVWSPWGEGDGGPATQAKIAPLGMTVSPDGTVYFLDRYGLREVRNGTITTLRRRFHDPASYSIGGLDVALGSDGSLYMAMQTPQGPAIMRHRWDRTLSVVAPAADGIKGIAAANDGSFYYSSGNDLVRRVSPDGKIVTIAGGGASGATADGGRPTAAGFGWLGRVAVGPDRAVYIADGRNSMIRKVEPLLTGGAYDGALSVISRDGTEVYLFDGDGRHLATVGRNGEPRLTFRYDSDGRLVGIRDADGNETTIQRDADGAPLAVLAPGGQRTQLRIDTQGFLSTVKNAAGESRNYVHSEKGLLLSYTDPRGQTHTYTYSLDGALVKDASPGGATMTLSQTNRRQESTTVVTTAEGRSETMIVAKLADGETERTTIDAAGLATITTVGTDGVSTTRHPDGTVTTVQEAPDPRYKMHAPMIAKQELVTPSGLRWTATSKRTAVVREPNKPFTLQIETDEWTINGRTYRSVYDAATRRTTTTTPAGRVSSTTFDAVGRPVLLEIAGLTPVTLSYDRGSLAAVSRGARKTVFTENELREVTAVRDAIGRETTFQYDAAGRVSAQTLPDGRSIAFTYDAAGNVTSVTPPGRPRHSFTYDAAGRVSTYLSPQAPATQHAYNNDGQLTTAVRPDGATIALAYDTAGRVSAIAGDGGTYGYSYLGSGQLEAITHVAQQLTFTYEGSLVTGVSSSGAVSGQVAWTRNNNLWLATESVNGNAINFAYDSDGLLTGAGALLLKRNAANGLLTQTQLGSVTDAWTYNGHGEVTRYAATYAGTPLLTLDYTRDEAGRITAIADSSFEYDRAGRLVRVKRGGTPVAEYDYDANSNRTAHRYIGGSVAATYDDEDRLLTYGDTSYEYTLNGDLKKKTIGTAVTTYDYDALGNLRSVEGAGPRIDYVIDGQNRRVGKKVSGTLVQGFLYADQLRVVAELDGANQLVSRFVYGSRSNVPDFMIKAGVTYRIVSDHLGSPRLIVNTANGSVAQSLTYDEFGRLLADSNPGFQPFGFAGGLYDRDTGLVRFGARDYDPQLGRWTAKEPLGFAGGDTNFYVYVLGDPVNLIDPNGLYAVWDDLAFTAGGALIGAGGQALADAINGQFSGWSSYGRAAAAGAAAGFATLYLGPIAGGAIGGLVSNGLNQTAALAAGTQCGVNWTSLAVDTGVGAGTGAIFGSASMSGGTRNGSAGHVFKTTLGRLRSGDVSRIRPATGAKMFIGAVDEYQMVPSVYTAIAASTAVNSLGDGGQCGCR